LKICTVAASFVTAVFNHELSKLCRDKGLEELEINLLPTFDCRMGCFDSFEEVFSLILWRAYDCGVNGISDAVHHNKKVEG